MQTNINGNQNVVAGGNVNFITNLKVNWPRLSGPIRLGVGLGLLLGLAGFASWGYFVLATVLAIFGAVTSAFNHPGIPMPPIIHFVNPAWLAVGAALMFGGLVLFAVSGLPQPAREKAGPLRATDP